MHTKINYTADKNSKSNQFHQSIKNKANHFTYYFQKKILVNPMIKKIRITLYNTIVVVVVVAVIVALIVVVKYASKLQIGGRGEKV